MKRAAGCAGCRAEPGPGTGTDRGVGNGPSPATGSWLALMTAPAQGCCSHPLLSILGEFWLPCSSGGSTPLPCSVLGQSAAPASRQPALWHCAPAAPPCLSLHSSLPVPLFPKFNFFPLPLEHCILFNPSPVTPAPALLQLDSKNNLFIHMAHAIIS